MTLNETLTLLLRLAITVLPIVYLAFTVRTAWGTRDSRFFPVGILNILVLELVWISGWLGGSLTLLDGIVPTTALALALLYLIYLSVADWRQKRRWRR